MKGSVSLGIAGGSSQIWGYGECVALPIPPNLDITTGILETQGSIDWYNENGIIVCERICHGASSRFRQQGCR